MTNKGCILVVDDTPADLEMLTDTLTMEGYQVLPATSGVLALAAVAAQPPELILLDIHMQTLDGFEVCRQLKARSETRDIPIVFISTNGQSAERVEGLKLGVRDYITKPFQREELLARIQILLEQSRSRLRLRQHTEQELFVCSSRQEALLATVPEVIMEVDSHKIYTWANQAGFAFFGDDVIGKEAAFYFVGEQQTYASVQSQIDSHQDIFCAESWQRRKDGEIRLLAWQCRALRDDTGNVTGFLSSGRDITERKQTEDTLRRKEYFLSESQRLGHIGSWFYDMTDPMEWSEETYRLHGVSLDKFTPSVESFLNLIHPDDRAAMQTWIAACTAGQKPDALDYRIIKPDGTMRFIRGYGEAVYDDKSGSIYLAGSVQDITEHKQTEQELRRFSTELEKNNNELQDALANVKQLSGLLPICASCKQIRDDSGYWQGVEMYISEHSNAEFSHGICPDCEEKMYDELDNFRL